MGIKLFSAGAAIALAATIGTASAAEQFSTIEGIAAQRMTQLEMGKVVGGHTTADLNVADGVFASDPVDQKGQSPFVVANQNGLDGILQGFVVRAPTCSDHPLSHP
jgi:hypothetical protein